MEKDTNAGNFIELMERHAVIDIPEDTVSMDIQVHVLIDGKMETVQKGFGPQDIRAMFNKADKGYFADDDMWMLTDKGREMPERCDDTAGV